MSFWKSELGDITGSAGDAFAKSFKQIPDGTSAIARINAFTNMEYQGNKYLNVEWILTDGEFKGQKVSQKIKVFDQDAKARFRSLNMLKLIYQLFKMQPQDSGPPSDNELSSFVGKVAGIKIRETEPNDEGKQYNWVSEVHPSPGFKCETGVKIEVTHVRKPGVETAFDRYHEHEKNKKDEFGLDNDVPF